MSNLQDEMLGSPVTPPGLGPGELAGSNPAISTKRTIKKYINNMTTFTQYQQQQQINRTD